MLFVGQWLFATALLTISPSFKAEMNFTSIKSDFPSELVITWTPADNEYPTVYIVEAYYQQDFETVLKQGECTVTDGSNCTITGLYPGKLHALRLSACKEVTYGIRSIFPASSPMPTLKAEGYPECRLYKNAYDIFTKVGLTGIDFPSGFTAQSHSPGKITAYWRKLEGSGYKYIIEAYGNADSSPKFGECMVVDHEQCTISRLQANAYYNIGIKVCANISEPMRCSSMFWTKNVLTKPHGMAIKSVQSDYFTEHITWTPVEGTKPFVYIVEAYWEAETGETFKAGECTSHDGTSCSIFSLNSGMNYFLRLSACEEEEDVSSGKFKRKFPSSSPSARPFVEGHLNCRFFVNAYNYTTRSRAPEYINPVIEEIQIYNSSAISVSWQKFQRALRYHVEAFNSNQTSPKLGECIVMDRDQCTISSLSPDTHYFVKMKVCGKFNHCSPYTEFAEVATPSEVTDIATQINVTSEQPNLVSTTDEPQSDLKTTPVVEVSDGNSQT